MAWPAHRGPRARAHRRPSGAIVGVRIDHGGRDIRVRARRGVVLGTGGFEWDAALVEAYLRGPMHGPVSPPNNTGDGLRMAMAHGADLANMGEAWWVPIIQIPGDTFDGHPRSRSVRLERTRPRSIIVNRAGKRFLNEAGEYNSMAGPFHHLDPRFGYVNDPAWIVFDSLHLKQYGFLGVDPTGRCPTGSASRRISPNSARRPASTPTGWPARSTSGTQRRRTSTIPISTAAQALTTATGATPRRRRTAGKTLGPDRHRAVLRGAGDRRRDGNQGRAANRPRRPRAARQRRSDTRPVCRGQRDGRRHRQGIRRRGRNHRPRNGVRLPGRHMRRRKGKSV